MDGEEISRIFHRCATPTLHPSTSQSAIEINTFLCAFELSVVHNSEDCVRVKSSLSGDDRHAIGYWIWGTAFSRNIDLLDELSLVLKSSSIAADDLVAMLLDYWLHLSSPALSNILHFHKLFRILCNSAGVVYLAAEPSEHALQTQYLFTCFIGPENFNNIETPSPWWQNLKELLSKSCNLNQACCAALVVRSVMAEFEKRKINRVTKSLM